MKEELSFKQQRKCVNSWCDNEADGYMCLRCEDIYHDAVLEAKEQDRIDKEDCEVKDE